MNDGEFRELHARNIQIQNDRYFERLVPSWNRMRASQPNIEKKFHATEPNGLLARCGVGVRKD